MEKIKRTKLLERKHDQRSAKLFIVATEDTYAPKQYFGMFGNRKVQFKILETLDGKSAPQFVLERLDKFKEKYDLSEEDELWLLLDLDRWVMHLRDVCPQARQKDYKLAISNPCFEVWLYLHFPDLNSKDKTCKHFEARLRKILGSYNKTNLDLALYKPKIQDAIDRARNLDLNPSAYWPSTFGSHVYKLVESIQQSLND
jgi:RloB-like protein